MSVREKQQRDVHSTERKRLDGMGTNFYNYGKENERGFSQGQATSEFFEGKHEEYVEFSTSKRSDLQQAHKI